MKYSCHQFIRAHSLIYVPDISHKNIKTQQTANSFSTKQIGDSLFPWIPLTDIGQTVNLSSRTSTQSATMDDGSMSTMWFVVFGCTEKGLSTLSKAFPHFHAIAKLSGIFTPTKLLAHSRSLSVQITFINISAFC